MRCLSGMQVLRIMDGEFWADWCMDDTCLQTIHDTYQRSGMTCTSICGSVVNTKICPTDFWLNNFLHFAVYHSVSRTNIYCCIYLDTVRIFCGSGSVCYIVTVIQLMGVGPPVVNICVHCCLLSPSNTRLLVNQLRSFVRSLFCVDRLLGRYAYRSWSGGRQEVPFIH